MLCNYGARYIAAQRHWLIRPVYIFRNIDTLAAACKGYQRGLLRYATLEAGGIAVRFE